MARPVRETDVLIVGGGPAGASAALSLLTYSGAGVMLVEHSDLSQIRVGEHVSSSIFELLQYLKINRDRFEPGSFIPTYSSVSYWGDGRGALRDSIFTTEYSGFQLDREKFDFKLLKQVAERGGLVFPRTRCTAFYRQEDQRWRICLEHPGYGKFDVVARYLMDATGRKSSVCRQIGMPGRRYDTLMGVGCFFHVQDRRAVEHEQIMEATEQGWWYRALLPNNIVVATFFSDADIISEHKLNQPDNWLALLRRTRHVRCLLEGVRPTLPRPWVRDASTRLARSPQISHFVAIGDAAASFDPVSSMGVGFAMSSACNAARLVSMALSGGSSADIKTFQQDIAANFNRYLALRAQCYQQEQRWPSSNFWSRRH